MTTEWMPIETAPKDGTKFLVAESCGEFAISHWFDRSHIEYVPVGDLFRRVEIDDGGAWNSNHFDWWMPLPEAPSAETRKRVDHCTQHGGLGFTRDCVECST